jgi:tetratricopeptide (TPR) repeat protein
MTSRFTSLMGRRRRGPGGGAAEAALVFVVLVMVFLGAGGAGAQTQSLTPAQKQEMRQQYEKATRAYDIKKYSEAIDGYQRIYEIGGDPAMLFNIAQSYRLNGQSEEALRFYRRYLQRSPNARNRDDVERKIGDLERTIDERRKAAAAAAAPVVVPPPVAPTAEPAPPVVPAPGPGGEGMGAVAVEDSGRGKRIAGVVLVSVGAAALITAGITGFLAKRKGDELSEISRQMGAFDPDVESSGKRLDKIMIISAIAGGALAAAGGVLLMLGWRSGPDERQAMVSPMLGPETLGAAAIVRF